MKPAPPASIRFPIVDCALEGFRVTRASPAAVAAWALALFLANLVLLTMAAALGLGPVLASIKPLSLGPLTPDMAARIEAAGPWLPGLLALFVGVNAVLYTALLRAVLEPQDRRFGYLRLGRQELRQLALWIYALASLTGFQLVLLVFETVGAAAAQGLQGAPGRVVLAGVAAASFVALLYPVVRLSLAPAMTFAERRLRLFSAWRTTRGQFWGMVGSYVTALLLAAAVSLLATVVIAPLISAGASLAGGGPDFLQRVAGPPDLQSIQGVFTPETLSSFAINALLMALALPILGAPAPAIYLALREAGARR